MRQIVTKCLKAKRLILLNLSQETCDRSQPCMIHATHKVCVKCTVRSCNQRTRRNGTGQICHVLYCIKISDKRIYNRYSTRFDAQLCALSISNDICINPSCLVYLDDIMIIRMLIHMEILTVKEALIVIYIKKIQLSRYTNNVCNILSLRSESHFIRCFTKTFPLRAYKIGRENLVTHYNQGVSNLYTSLTNTMIMN